MTKEQKQLEEQSSSGRKVDVQSTLADFHLNDKPIKGLSVTSSGVNTITEDI